MYNNTIYTMSLTRLITSNSTSTLLFTTLVSGGFKNNGVEADVTEQAGHDELISIIETQVKTKSPKEIKVQEKFEHFLHLVKERATYYR